MGRLDWNSHECHDTGIASVLWRRTSKRVVPIRDEIGGNVIRPNSALLCWTKQRSMDLKTDDVRVQLRKDSIDWAVHLNERANSIHIPCDYSHQGEEWCVKETTLGICSRDSIWWKAKLEMSFMQVGTHAKTLFDLHHWRRKEVEILVVSSAGSPIHHDDHRRLTLENVTTRILEATAKLTTSRECIEFGQV